DSEPRDQELLRGERGRRPAAFLLVGRKPAHVSEPLCERRGLEEDDDALPDRDARALRACQAFPARRTDRRRPARSVAARGDQDQRDGSRKEGQRQRVDRLTRKTRTHRAQDNEDTGWPP